MNSDITQYYLTLTRNILISLLFLSCNESNHQIYLPSGKYLKIKLAITPKEQEQGLSGVKTNEFGSKEGMLFVYKNSAPRRFWMIDTYFNLDIIFLDKDLNIIEIARDMPAHPGRNVPPEISKTPIVTAKYILEIKSNSPISQEIKIGQQLNWPKKEALLKIISNTHSLQ